MRKHMLPSGVTTRSLIGRAQLSRALGVLYILTFLTSQLGMNPSRAVAQEATAPVGLTAAGHELLTSSEVSVVPAVVAPNLESQVAIPSASSDAGGTEALSPMQPPLAPDCGNPTNEIVAENCLPGNPASEWDVDGAGDASIQGYATDISVNQGETVHFKIDTHANAYHIDVYRIGYYDGNGARLVAAGIAPTAELPQIQPACLFDGADDINLVDCGNWIESASWAVPANATSGLYIAKLISDDVSAPGASHITFIVRDDLGGSDLLFQTSDTTWQAYNGYGDYSLYAHTQHAHKVSYNRPFSTRSNSTEDFWFNSEYPMIRWLERNGYDVSYSTDLDTDRRGTELLEHKVFMSVGHDEYWSAGQRAAVEAARDVGVNLAFLSGNEIYWKTRWEPSTDGSNTPYRTLVSYKDGTLAPGGSSEHYTCYGTDTTTKCDPEPGVWTGLWRDGCTPTNLDACKPENALSGNISWVGTTGIIQVPAADGKMRFWRDTAIASASTTTNLAADTLGYEWDYEQYPNSYPAGRFWLTTTNSDNQTHHVSLYRAASGALVFAAGTVQWAWGLDGNHDRGSSSEDASMQQATANLFADMGVQPGSLQDDLTPPTPSVDTNAPTSETTSPLDGATVSGMVTVTGTATDAGGGVIGAVEVSVDGGTTWHSATGRENWSYSWTPAVGSVTITSRAVDDSGNIGAPSTGNTVTVEPRTCPCSIWEGTGTPAPLDENDAQPIEVGVKFRAAVDGYITGLRFYKASTNTGTHVGHLWTSSGTQLAEATFSGETGSGWQDVTLGAPVAITANTTYIASYHSSANHYSATVGYFASGVDNPPVRALANGEDGANGVYKYGASGSFPDQTYSASNYWVDVVFNTEVGPDNTPPAVSSVTPADNATNVSTSANVSALFNEPLDPDSVGTETFELRHATDAPVAAVVSYDNLTRTATLDPSAALAYSTTYTATLIGGATDPRIKDLAGNALASDAIWSFTTTPEPLPPPDEGPGGPILVVSSAANPFGRYYAEILRAEGLNEFTATDISTLGAGIPAGYDVVILGEMPLTSAQVTMLTDWVDTGGKLIAMRPDAQLANLLGLTGPSGTLAEGYLLVNTTAAPGAGIVNQTIQFHGTADRYTLDGATEVARLYSDTTTPTDPASPAVTLRSVGSSGGQAASFTYDLAKSVIYTRQGNPAWAGINGDGNSGPVRADDMFHNGTDPDWVNLDKVAIPQADEQQRLLVNMILSMDLEKMPLPRFWYFPRGEKAVVVMTEDEHGTGDLVGRLNSYNAASPIGCLVNDWKCVRSTSYIYTNAQITDSELAAFQAQGHEFVVHILTGCDNFTPASLADDYATQIPALKAQFPSINAPLTQRTHCIAFSDWSSQPKVELQNGIRLDTNYYYWPADWVLDRPGMFTGSGMPMRFADTDGTMIDVYQATTQMTDESGLTIATHIDTLLDNALGAPGYYGVFTANMHTDGGANASNGAASIVASAQAHGVPVVSAQQMLAWLDGRNGSSFANIIWSDSTLSFDVDRDAGASGLQAMLPVHKGDLVLQDLTRDGSVSVDFTIEPVKGISYAQFAAASGAYVATYEVDNTAPTVSAVSPTADATGVAVNTDVTAEFSEAIDPPTLNSGGFELRDTVAETVVSATVSYNDITRLATLTPSAALATGTQYTAKLKGSTGGVSDMAGNPLASDYIWSFTTAADIYPECSHCSIWDNTATPATSPVNDGQPIELGTKFRADTAGYITALRFYKGSGDTDTHVGHLWTSLGVQLAEVTFTDETPSGWQEMVLPAPVHIDADTTYVVSIFSSPVGNFSITLGGLATVVNNPPLRALAAGEDGVNGVYKYGGRISVTRKQQ